MDEDLLNDLDDLNGDDGASISSGEDEDKMDEDVDTNVKDLLAASAPANDIKSVTKLLNSRQLTELIQAINHLKSVPRPPGRNSGPVEEDPEYKILVKATDYSADVDTEILIVHRFIKEKYSPRFPELETLIPNAIDYARTVKTIGNEMDLMNVDLRSLLPSATVMIVTVTATTTSGRQLTDEELSAVMEACDAALSLDSIKRTILEYIESRMTFIAPNLSAILGSSTAAKLMGVAGGLTNLSKIPSCNLQVLGKANKGLTGGMVAAKGQEKHAGFIFFSDFVQSFPKDYRVKACRMISAKCTLAARVDRERESSDGSTGRRMREEIEKKLEKLQEPPPGKNQPAATIPTDKPQKAKTSKLFPCLMKGHASVEEERDAYIIIRVRHMKERLAVTEAWKAQNRVKFGEAEEEVIAGDTVKGLGLLGKDSGRLRMQGDPSKKLSVAKKHQKRLFSGSSGATNGLSSSLAFTPVQGLELENPDAVAARRAAQESGGRYFGTSFLNTKKA
ncbi:U4/U6 small nuclear ribonucleoprotein Prp31 [Dinochytrium kinnereticum]|nr:U4/U6 small nuclear ribonucleoprotein Prp31 [Dinochytrium kinnereticum]